MVSDPVLYTHNAVFPTPCVHVSGCTIKRGEPIWSLHFIDGTRKSYCGLHYHAHLTTHRYPHGTPSDTSERVE